MLGLCWIYKTDLACWPLKGWQKGTKIKFNLSEEILQNEMQKYRFNLLTCSVVLNCLHSEKLQQFLLKLDNKIN